jgi:hypothetical protein
MKMKPTNTVNVRVYKIDLLCPCCCCCCCCCCYGSNYFRRVYGFWGYEEQPLKVNLIVGVVLKSKNAELSWREKHRIQWDKAEMIHKEEKGITRHSEKVGIHKNNASPSADEVYQCIPHGSLCYKIGSSDVNNVKLLGNGSALSSQPPVQNCLPWSRS